MSCYCANIICSQSGCLNLKRQIGDNGVKEFYYKYYPVTFCDDDSEYKELVKKIKKKQNDFRRWEIENKIKNLQEKLDKLNENK